jgi:hypothetical protein
MLPTTDDFLTYAQWSGIATLAFAGLAVLSFFIKWGIRFRLVGVTGFMAVLTVGLFALSVVPFTRTTVPGAIRFSTVYDSGATQVVIAVPPTITVDELDATLQQAANDLFSPGRLSRGEDKITIRARTVLHPEPRVSQPLYLGQIRRSLFDRDDDSMTIELIPDNIAKLPPAPTPASERPL